MRRKCFIVAGAAVIALATVALFSVSIRPSFLVLTNDHSGETLFKTRLNAGEEFTVSFIHSVNISPVSEIFQFRDGQIVLTASEFETFGAGMPTELEPGQTLIRLPEGGMRIEGFDRIISGLRYMIGHTTEHTLHIGSRQIPLITLDAPGQPVLFEIIHLNIWQRLINN
jgi:hypothetical protein